MSPVLAAVVVALGVGIAIGRFLERRRATPEPALTATQAQRHVQGPDAQGVVIPLRAPARIPFRSTRRNP